MSQRGKASGPGSSTTHGTFHSPQEGAETLNRIQSDTGSEERTLDETGREAIKSHGGLLTSSATEGQASKLEEDRVELKPSRSIGVHSILNPTLPEVGKVDDQRPGAPRTEPPITETSSRYLFSSGNASSINVEPRSGGSPHSFEPRFGVRNRPQRHILTPKSPTASLGRINPPAGTIDAQQSPFLSSRPRVYTAEPRASRASEVPTMPAPPAASQYTFSLPQPSGTVPPLSGRRPSIGAIQGPVSRSVSPSTSYSSFSQQSQTSPAVQYGPPLAQTGASYNSPMFRSQSEMQEAPPIQLASERPFGSAAPSLGQSNYQLMTLDTDQGPIQVPVDTQAASKMADEKRKRNAGASARFRQRRKEKEKEAGHTIGKLEQQVRDLTEDTNYYRRERDYFRHMYFSAPGQVNLAPRPPSPRLRRVRRSSSEEAVSDPPQWHEEGGRADTERNTRRRISSFPPAYSLPPPSTIVAPAMSTSYGPPPMFVGQHDNPRVIFSGRGAPQAAVPRNAPYDPYSQSRLDRSRQPDREQR
ncbi:MAG: hypothetical protein M1835_002086 [Candelina submexicana]|nr:MAG: hypothetical protein M1835_002086 [Candelina submexicana]